VRRWLTPTQLAEQLAERDPRVAKLNQKRRREYAVRLVRRVEKLEEMQFLKRSGARILVSWRALESLLPPSVTTVDLLDQNVATLSQGHRHLAKRVNDHGSQIRAHAERLRAHEARIVELEEKEAARREYEAKIRDIESRSLAAQVTQKVPSAPILKRARKPADAPQGDPADGL